MSRLADPRVCPDCRADLDPDGRCRGCGLHLRGPLAVELWGVMQTADALVERLRAAVPAPAPVAAPVAVTRPVTGPVPVPVAPGPPPSAPPGRRTGVPASSVPVVLLTLGGLCLMVFALIFIGVAWSLLGLLGRTLVLLAVTASLGGVAGLMTRRGLRASAEVMWVVTAGMLAIDLYAARASGLLGLDALPDRAGHALVGAALLGLGLGVSLLARRTPLGAIWSMQGVAVAGAALVAAAQAWTRPDPAAASTLAVVLAAALGLAVRPRLRGAGLGLLALAPVSWLVLLGAGVLRSLEPLDAATWWAQGRWWPLLAAAVLAAVVVHAPRVPAWARPWAAGLALVPVVAAVNAPGTLGSAAADEVAMVVSVLLLAAVSALAGPTWARAGAVLTAVGTLLLGLVLVGRSLVVVGDVLTGPTAPATGLLAAPSEGAVPSWTAVVLALGVVLGAASLLRHAAGPAVPVSAAGARGVVLAAAPGVLALGLLVLLLGLEPVRWTAALGGLVATGVAAGAAWWWRREVPAAVAAATVAAYVGLLTLALAAGAGADEAWLPAAVTTALALPALAASLLRDREGAATSASLLAGAGVLLGGVALVTWGAQLDVGETVQAVALASYAAAAGLLAAPVTRLVATRVALETAALVAAAGAVALAPGAAEAAVALTVTGSAVALLAVLHRDRESLAWLATVLLAAATLLRVVAEVTAPELVTLPAAALLLAVGTLRLRRDATVGSTRVLGSGLVLALVPSLLLALADPVSLRGALLGAAAVLTLAWGVTQRLAAPFTVGAAVTAVLVLRHLGPVADAVPRWVTIGAVGVALLVVGVTWESSLRSIDRARRYVTSLR
ncbi:hypothetical protein ASG49_17190 [Marmoricola sp. Leaf446]|uniref:SCO7613 C-terminal domain-containing membrane protein n=1 Tax=Marmoricola sp. Leaf446 TaxID=1736379 RepID=UPI0006F9BFB7|nr:hypothetical protein [Marmoricola sp. Leaf446]KQT89480.1 hypothetical protein ASG49_17190 [Marmoricola sp. Leaf446]